MRLDLRPLVLCAAMLASSPSLAESPKPAPGPAPGDGTNPLAPVRIALQWSPQSQFAGFYLAREQGFYAAAGADVRFVHTNAQRSSLDWLQAGDAELATAFLADAMVAAGADAIPDNGSDAHKGAARPVLIGQLVQRSNLMLLAWKDHGIEHLEDLDGQRISLWPGPFTAAVHALLSERQVSPELIPQYGTVNLFLHGGVSACAAMEYNEYHRIWQAGVDEDRLTVFLLRDLGFDFPRMGFMPARTGLSVTAPWRNACGRPPWMAGNTPAATRSMPSTGYWPNVNALGSRLTAPMNAGCSSICSHRSLLRILQRHRAPVVSRRLPMPPPRKPGCGRAAHQSPALWRLLPGLPCAGRSPSPVRAIQ
jgi:hypothetical protein